MSGQVRSWACFAGVLGFALALQAQARVPGLSPSAWAVAERVLATESGSAFARRLLGPNVTRFNPNGSREVFNTLLHPENRFLAESFSRRVTAIDESVSGLRREPRFRSVTEAERLKLEGELIATEANARFSFTAGVRPEEIVFADGERVLIARTAYNARREAFLIGGELAAGPGSRPAVPHSTAIPTDRFPTGYNPNAFEQLVQWEEQASLRYFRETEQIFGLEMARVDAAGVELQFGSRLPEGVRRSFVREGFVMWPKHPYNTDATVPYFTKAATERWPARFTASRSLVVWNKRAGTAFSLKAPTNYPHRTELQAAKANLSDDIDSALVRSEYLDRLDVAIGTDDRVVMLREILTAAESESGNGFVVRELTPLMDGHYYVPALSIPYAGEGIARANGAAFAEFWGKAYADTLGRAKARLLVRYGLQMVTPNSQNMLIQLDRGLRPTGRIVFRDVSDSYLVRPVAEAMGETEALARELRIEYEPHTQLKPFAENSFWRLDEDPVQGVSRQVIRDWIRLHDEAYVDEVLKLLGVGRSPAARSIGTIQELQGYLFSGEGRAAVRRFHESLRAAARRAPAA